VALRIVGLDLDIANPSGRLMIDFFSIALFERELMLERQREGVAAADAAGKYKVRGSYSPSQGRSSASSEGEWLAPPRSPAGLASGAGAFTAS